MKKIKNYIITALITLTVGVTACDGQEAGPIKDKKYEYGEQLTFSDKTGKMLLLRSTRGMSEKESNLGVLINSDSTIVLTGPGFNEKGSLLSIVNEDDHKEYVFVMSNGVDSVRGIMYEFEILRSSDNTKHELLSIVFETGYLFKYFEREPEESDSRVLSR